MSEWISVEDRLPEHENKKHIFVLAFRPDAIFDGIAILKYRRSYGFAGVLPVTYWMPLPDLPED